MRKEDNLFNKAKAIWKEYQLNKCRRLYEKRVEERSNAYGMWIRENEQNLDKATLDKGTWDIPLLTLSEFVEIATSGSGQLPTQWFCVRLVDGDFCAPKKETRDRLVSDSSIGLCYADEDEYEYGKRKNPWFKPDVYSPDTLFSYFYFGSFLLINGAVLSEFLELKIGFFGKTKEEVLQALDKTFDASDVYLRAFFYDFVFAYIEFLNQTKRRVFHISEVLFHAETTAYWGFEPEYAAIKQNFSDKFWENACHEYGKDSKKSENEPSVSIIIPSKDHPQVLRNCIESIVIKTDYSNYDIVIVDNGSNPENREKIERIIADFSNCKIKYLYDRYHFNYSKMINRGAKEANGELLLLLNDDIEAFQPDWLRKMVEKAILSHIGAVGAKLLYPNSNRIQHIGVYNLAMTPEHMLMGLPDDKDYYYGKNVFPQNVIAVTAACLLLRKSLFDEIGGLYELLTVSYNDVDLCFSLYEKGFYNIVCNDVALYHHESLSRGADVLNDAKWERQMTERKLLYQRHPQLAGKDPFYNPNLAGFKNQFLCNYLYEYEIRNKFGIIKQVDKKEFAKWNNEAPILKLETVRVERSMDTKFEKDTVCISGWAFVSGMDNSRYRRWLHLTNEQGESILVEVFDKYRKDVADVFSAEENIYLAGFECRISKDMLREADYKVAMLFKDACSRQLLYKDFVKKMEVSFSGKCRIIDCNTLLQ